MKIVTLTLNPAFDTHCFTPAFRPYHENICEITDNEAGGKGVNISRALCVCGVDNTALVIVGADNADAFLRALQNDGLTVDAVRVPGRIRENITLHTTDAPETRISFPGFAVDDDVTARVADYVKTNVGAGDVLTMTGSLPAGMDKKAVMAMLSDAKARGAHVVIDSRSFTLDDLFAVGPWLVKPNEDEMAAYLGLERAAVPAVQQAAQDWHARGIENVMVSLGGEGACLRCDGGFFTAPAPRIAPLSTIGAGDSSVAGFIAAFAQGKSAADCLRSAVAYGSAACLTPGTRPPRKEDVQKFLAK